MNTAIRIGFALSLVFGIGLFYTAGNLRKVSADMSPQTLTFSQDWSNAGLITVDDDWSGVLGITGFRGDGLNSSTNTDPRTILADGSSTPVDVNANETNPDTFTSGGVAEFDTITDPTVALQGSGTADAPHIVIYLNTTGNSNIGVQYNARDVDGQTNNDATQQINTQYRVGGTGDYTNVTGGYIADAAMAGTTQVTPVDVVLPAAANNQALVEVRVMTTNAGGSDEWIGIDDITISAGPIYDNGGLATGTSSNSGATAPSGFEWSEAQNETGNTTESNTLAGVSCSTTATLFRCADDFTVPAGETWTIDEVVVFAYQTGFGGSTSPITAATLRIWDGRPGDMGSSVIFGDDTTDRLGSTGDALLYRLFNSAVPPPGSTPGTSRRIWRNVISVSPAQVLTDGTYWIDWNTSIGTSSHFAPPVTMPGIRGLAGWNARQEVATGWQDVIDGGNPASAPDFPMDFPFKLMGSVSATVNQDANTDFDGDGITDFNIVRDETTPFSLRNNEFFKARSVREKMRLQQASRGGFKVADPASKHERTKNSNLGAAAGTSNVWYVDNSQSGSVTIAGFGTAATDFIVPEDYDGDGKDDLAVWRATGPTSASFFILQSSDGMMVESVFGQQGDNPTVVGDYDGDGNADVAVFRCPPLGGGDGQCFYFFRGSDSNPGGDITYIPWGFGETLDFFPNPGDFDGDGKYDFCFQRDNPANPGQGEFVLLNSGDSSVEYIAWGGSNDFIVPGDYDGDGRSDFMVRRSGSSPFEWFLLESDGGGTGAAPILWGVPGDAFAPGDYDGDGKQDIAIWRPNADPASNFFYVRRSSDAMLQVSEWGEQNDFPAAGWYVN